MATASGQVTNAVFGFTSMLINVLKDHGPTACSWPSIGRSRRSVTRPSRSTRPSAKRRPTSCASRWGWCARCSTPSGSSGRGGRLGGRRPDRHAEPTVWSSRATTSIIVTGDRDSYQLVSDPHVKVLYNKRGVSDYAFYDEAGIEERTGVTPALYPQYAALRGDNSDNLPGVPGVGEKTAAKLINKYGGLDGIFAHVDEQTPKLRENLIEHEQRARKNLELMILRHDAPIDGRPRRPGDHTEPRRAASGCSTSSSSARSAIAGTRCSDRVGRSPRARRATNSWPRSRCSTTRSRRVAVLARRPGASTSPLPGRASPAGARCRCGDRDRCRGAEVAWIPGAVLA